MIAKLDPDGTIVPSVEYYGPCSACGGTLERRDIEIPLGSAEPRVVWPDVPQGACPACGSRVFKMCMLELLEARWASMTRR